MPTTEIVVLPLAAGSDIGNPSNSAAVVLKETGDQLSKQAGVQQIQFGTQAEDPNTLQLLVNWEDIDSHEAFKQADVYKSFAEKLVSIADTARFSPKVLHVDFQPEADFAKATSAPVTEIVTCYFDGKAPANYAEGVSRFLDVTVKENFDGFLGAAGGLTQEDDVERDGVKGSAAVLVVGWKSVEKHVAFRETRAFKDNIHLLRNGVHTTEMRHVQFFNFVAGQ